MKDRIGRLVLAGQILEPFSLCQAHVFSLAAQSQQQPLVWFVAGAPYHFMFQSQSLLTSINVAFAGIAPPATAFLCLSFKELKDLPSCLSQGKCPSPSFASSKQSLHIWPRKLQAQHCISSPSSIWEAFQLGIIHCKANSNTIHLGWIDSSCLGWEHHLGVSVWYLLCLAKFCFKILNTEKMAAVMPQKNCKNADLSSPGKKGNKKILDF